MPLDTLRRRIEQVVERLIELLDLLDAEFEDLDDTGEREPDDTGIADEDALAVTTPAQRDWFDDWRPPYFDI